MTEGTRPNSGKKRAAGSKSTGAAGKPKRTKAEQRAGTLEQILDQARRAQPSCTFSVFWTLDSLFCIVLGQAAAPRTIEYLSLDIEGAYQR